MKIILLSANLKLVTWIDAVKMHYMYHYLHMLRVLKVIIDNQLYSILHITNCKLLTFSLI